MGGGALSADELFDGTDPTQAVLRATDWVATALGPVDSWPGELHAAVRTVLASRVPMLLWWGQRCTQLYNDAFRPLIGNKHPRAIGQDAADCYPEAWPELEPEVPSLEAGRWVVSTSLSPETWQPLAIARPHAAKSTKVFMGHSSLRF